MRKLNAFGAIDLLIGLVIISVLIIMMMPRSGSGGGSLGPSALKTKEIESDAYKMINDIQQKQQQAENQIKENGQY